MTRRRSPNQPIADVVARLDADDARELLIRAAEWHNDVERALRLTASRDDADLSGLRSAVDSALRTRRFLDWRESSGWAADSSPVAAELRTWAEEDPSRELVKLIERGIGHVVKVILHADDSNGSIGDLAQDLLGVHAVACDAGVADPLDLARWMARFGMDDQDFFVVDPVRYQAALGAAGIAAYRTEVQRRAASSDPPFAVGHALERLAVLDGDIDALVGLLGGDQSRPHQFIRLAEAMSELGRDEDVLSWAIRGIEATSGWQVAQLYDMAAGVHERRGDAAKVLELRRDEQRRMPSPSTYKKLRLVAESTDTWSDERSAALAALDNGGLVDVLLEEGDAAGAWDVAVRNPGWDPGLDRRYRLAGARQASEPAEALLVYQSLADAALETANQKSYQRAAHLLVRAKQAAEEAGCEAAFNKHILALRELHRRRPTLIKILDKAGLRV